MIQHPLSRRELLGACGKAATCTRIGRTFPLIVWEVNHSMCIEHFRDDLLGLS